jgi:hypothetical protein
MGTYSTMKPTEKRLLREYLRRKLREEFGDYGYGQSYGGVTPWSSGYGGSSKGSRSSSGTYGNSLYSIFVDPFVQAAKVVGAELGQTGVRLASLAAKTTELALDVLVPGFQADYAKVDKLQKKYLDKIKEKYKPAYEAVADNWNHPDIQLFAFMHDPTTWLTYKAITAKPEAALSVYDAIAEGSQTLTLYLRDIRNRLFGASAPGAGLQAGPAPLPVRGESLRRTLRGVLRENGEVVKNIDFQGLEISIDRPKGFVQTGTNQGGEGWEREYLFDYGFIKGTEGGDGEDLDVFVGPDADATEVYLVTQNHSDGTFDEYKAFVGFSSEDEALMAYEAHIPTDYFDSITAIPLGALKGIMGLDPLEEAAPTRAKTPAEQLADILTSPQFLAQVNSLPVVKQMKKDATALESQGTTQLKNAMRPVLAAQTAAELAAASNGSWSPPPEYAQLDPEEKQAFDDTVVKQVKASMATFYEAQLQGLLKQATETGINDQSPYVTSIQRMITSLEPVKQQAAAPTMVPSKGTNAHGQEKSRSAPDAAGRAQGAGDPGGGVRKQAPGGGRGDRPAEGGPQGNNRGVRRETGHKDAERGSEDSEDKDIKRPKTHS